MYLELGNTGRRNRGWQGEFFCAFFIDNEEAVASCGKPTLDGEQVGHRRDTSKMCRHYIGVSLDDISAEPIDDAEWAAAMAVLLSELHTAVR